jgi:hypothetical protein
MYGLLFTYVVPLAQSAGDAGGLLVKSIGMFLDGPGAKARDAVHVIFAGEYLGADSLAPSPDVSKVDSTGPFRIVDLEPLVWMKFTSCVFQRASVL